MTARMRRQHAFLGRARRGQDLGGEAPLAELERDVGEGAADIDAEAGGALRMMSRENLERAEWESDS